MVRSENPLESFERILHWQHLILKLYGYDGFSPKFQINAKTYVTTFLVVCFMVISFYDLYLFRNDVFNFAFDLVTICYWLVGVTRLRILLFHSSAACDLVLNMKKVYREASSDGGERLVILKYTRQLKQCVIIYSVMYLGGCVLAEILPLVVYLWNGDKILPFGIMIPFIDPNSTDGYELNYLYQVSCLFWAPIGLTASQNFYFALVFNICIQYDVLVLKVQHLDDMIAKNVDGELNGEIRDGIVNIIQYQQRLVNFISDLEKLYTFQTLIEVACNSIQIVITLFVLHIDMWLPGYIVIIVSTFQLLLWCMLGTQIEVKSDVFTAKIYNISWHALPKDDKKMLKFMLEMSQQSQKLSCGRMMTINMNLFVAVYKKIYTIFMMLLNV